MSGAVLTRRTLVAGGLAVAAMPASARPARTVRLIAGTYAKEGGAGLYPITYDAGRDDWTVASPASGIDDASFGLFSSRRRLRYWLHEGTEGRVGAYRQSAAIGPLVSTGGADPCHAALDATQSALAIANYSSGSVALFRLDRATGRIVAPGQVVAHRGHGPRADRQEGPHAHWVGFSPDGQWLHAVDLGADAIFAHAFDAHGVKLGDTKIAYQAPAGSGPRHLARHPTLPVAYLVSELANSLTTLNAATDGGFSARDIRSTLPAGFGGASQAAHIAINAAATRLYVSNRGHDSIAVFALAADGMPTLLQHVSTEGRWPRFFLLLEKERRLIVGNERSGEIAVFAVAADGRLTATSRRLKVPGVVFLGTDG